MSSSTTWYTLGFIESVRGVRKGDRVLQVGVGSGVKAGMNVWKVRAPCCAPGVPQSMQACASNFPHTRIVALRPGATLLVVPSYEAEEREGRACTPSPFLCLHPLPTCVRPCSHLLQACRKLCRKLCSMLGKDLHLTRTLQALRSVDDVQEAWAHRATPERFAAASVSSQRYSFRGRLARQVGYVHIHL